MLVKQLMQSNSKQPYLWVGLSSHLWVCLCFSPRVYQSNLIYQHYTNGPLSCRAVGGNVTPRKQCCPRPQVNLEIEHLAQTLLYFGASKLQMTRQYLVIAESITQEKEFDNKWGLFQPISCNNGIAHAAALSTGNILRADIMVRSIWRENTRNVSRSRDSD